MLRAQRDSHGLITLTALKLLAIAAGSLAVWSLIGLVRTAQQETHQKPATISATQDPAAREFLLTLAAPRTEGRRLWEVKLALRDAQLLNIEPIAGRAEVLNQSAANAELTARSRVVTKNVRKRKRRRKVSTSVPAVFRLVVRTGADAVLALSTNHGDCRFELRALGPGRSERALGGSVTLTARYHSQQLTSGDLEEDFPAAVRAADGTVWVAYVSYAPGGPIQLPAEPLIPNDWSSLVPKGNGDQVLLARFDGRRWSGPLPVSAARLDVWRPTVAVDGKGNVVVVWSQNFDGNWDLVIRVYNPQENRWSKPRRLGGPGADIHAVAATDSNGRVWIACQSWQQDNFDIVVLHQTEDGWSDPVAIGKSPANEWTPSIATDRRGNVYVAFDTYAAGNYDVKLAVIRAGRAEAARVVAIATGPKFEARPTVAVDRQGRVWVAYEEADANWGKDQGQRWNGPSGVPFYLRRSIVVRCLAKEGVRETVGRIVGRPTQTRYPPERFQRVSLPRIAIASDGRLWVLFRQHPLVSGAGEVWESWATYYEGERWSEPVALPNSRNLLDNRPAIVPLDNGRLLVIHSTDYRNSTASRRQDDLYATVVAGPVGEPSEPALRPPRQAESGELVVVHPNEAEDVARIRRFRFRHAGKEYRLLRGEFHRHTELTAHRDQDGLFEAIFRYALDVAKLDWIGPGDHDNGAGKEYMWWLTQKQVDIYHHPPVFTPMFTYERSVRYPSGHRNVMFAERGIRPLPRLQGQGRLMGTAEQGAPDIKRLYAYLRHFGGICSVHTSATNMGTDWRDNDPEVEPVVEIYQGHRQNYEHLGAPYTAKGPGDSIGGYQPAGYVWNALQKGYKLGFQVSSDHVSTHLSYGVVLVEEVSRRGILEAFKKRHSYGAMDNIIAVVTCGDHLMGDTFRTGEKPTIRITAIGTAPIARVSIVRGAAGQTPTYVFETRPAKQEVRLEWTDRKPLAGTEAYYYVRIEQADGRVAWISPMWITYEP